MTLFTIKKATVIYRLRNSLLLILFLTFSLSIQAIEDLTEYCFSPKTNLSEARDSLSFLLLPREKIFVRAKDYCFDVLTSPDRAKLLEKFLRKRYNLVSEVESPTATSLENCRLEFKSIRQKKIDGKNIQVGVVTSVNLNDSSSQEVSTMELLLGLGKPGVLDVGGKSLHIECRKGATGVYQLNFAFEDFSKAKVQSSVSLKENEVLKVAQVLKDLNEKNKTLGLPESSFQETNGSDVTEYELQIK